MKKENLKSINVFEKQYFPLRKFFYSFFFVFLNSSFLVKEVDFYKESFFLLLLFFPLSKRFFLKKKSEVVSKIKNDSSKNWKEFLKNFLNLFFICLQKDKKEKTKKDNTFKSFKESFALPLL
jgi:hypothetical protein